MRYYGIDILMPSVKDYLDKIREYTGIEAESAAADAAGKYNDKIALEVAHGLVSVAQSLKDKDAVIQRAQILSSDEIVKAVSRYDGAAAKRIAWDLSAAALYLRDKDAVIQIAQAVSRYDGAAAEEIAWDLYVAALSLEDKDAVIQVAQILSSDEIVKAVSRYEGDTAKEIAKSLADAARSLKDKDAVVQIAQVVSKYESAAAKGIAWSLADAARSLKDKDTVVQIAHILSSNEIVKAVSRYDSDVAEVVAWALADAARSLKDKDAVIHIAQVISKYEGAAAKEIACSLADAARSPKDAGMMTKYITMLDTVNKFGMVDKIISTSGAKIVKEGLDALVTDKNSLWSCLAYVDGGCKFPKPTNQNIGSYRSIVNDFVKSEYGISVQLSLDQISLLASLKDGVSNSIVEFVNASAPQHEMVYIIDNGKNAVNFEPAAEKMPEEKKQLAIISIIGSKDKNKFEEAQNYIKDIVGEKKVNVAYTKFNGICKKEHPNLKSDVIRLFKNGDYDSAAEALRSAGVEEISDVMDAAEGVKSVGPAASGSRTVYAFESKNPLDYDSRIILACTCINGAYANKGMLNYCKDPNILLVGYSFGGQVCASAICYIEGNVLLVDSVEGRERIRNDAFFGVIRKDIEEKAKLHGVDTIIFSEGAINKTSTDFLKFLERRGAERGSIEMKIDTQSYLEADKGKVKGYLIRV